MKKITVFLIALLSNLSATLIQCQLRQLPEELMEQLLIYSADNNPRELALLRRVCKQFKRIIDGIKPNQDDTLLHQTTSEGKVLHTRILLEQGNDPNSRDKQQMTPLHRAALHGHIKLVTLLLTYKADPNATDCFGHTPIHYTAQKGYAAIARLLIHHGANVTIAPSGLTPLHYAADQDHLDVALAIITHMQHTGITLLNAQDIWGKTPLHYATEKGAYLIVTTLIQLGAQVDIVDQSFKTPLHYAAEKGHLALAQLLVLHRADTGIQDCFGETAQHRAACHGHTAIVDFLAQQGTHVHTAASNLGWTSLHLAIMHNHLPSAAILLDHRANINAQDNGGNTPLHLAAAKGSYACTKMLVEKGADMYLQNNNKQAPIHLAFAGGHSDIVKLLHARYTTREAIKLRILRLQETAYIASKSVRSVVAGFYQKFSAAVPLILTELDDRGCI